MTGGVRPAHRRWARQRRAAFTLCPIPCRIPRCPAVQRNALSARRTNGPGHVCAGRRPEERAVAAASRASVHAGAPNRCGDQQCVVDRVTFLTLWHLVARRKRRRSSNDTTPYPARTSERRRCFHDDDGNVPPPADPIGRAGNGGDCSARRHCRSPRHARLEVAIVDDGVAGAPLASPRIRYGPTWCRHDHHDLRGRGGRRGPNPANGDWWISVRAADAAERWHRSLHQRRGFLRIER